MSWTGLGVLLLALSASPPVALAARARARAGADDLSAAVRRAVDKCGLPSDRVSVAVVDPRTGELLAGHLATRERTPASCLKVATTAAALLSLGADHPLRTRLAAVPPGADAPSHVVPGDLWLLGGGDPGLSEHGPEGDTLLALETLARRALARGVRVVRGDLVFDASYFSGPRVHSSWTDAGASARWFAAEVDALTVNDGCVDVTVHPPGDGSPQCRVDVYPETTVVDVVPELTSTTSRKEHGFRFLLEIPANRLHVKGRVWTKTPGSMASASIHDPALLCAEQVGRALARAGIRIEGVVRRRRSDETPPGGMAVLAEHVTTLGQACAVANTRSQNLWAETVLRVLGAESGTGGSFEGGTAAVRRILDPEGTGLAATLHPVDGSGLSRENRASAEALARAMARVWNSPQRDAYFQGMAQPGSGTLEHRLGEERFEGRVFAKTGTLRGVSGLCGLALGPSDAPRVFAVLGDRVEVGRARQLQDAVVGLLVGPSGSGEER